MVMISSFVSPEDRKTLDKSFFAVLISLEAKLVLSLLISSLANCTKLLHIETSQNQFIQRLSLDRF